MSSHDDTSPAPLDGHKRRIRWDPTINLGHVLTFFGFLATGSVAYFDLRERLAVQEVRVSTIENEGKAAAVRFQETLREVRDDVREVRRGVEDLNRRKP